MAIDHDDVATQLVYLIAGTENKTKLYYITERLKGTHTDHPLLSAGGHIGMVSDLLPYAKQVAEYLAFMIGKQDFPGVFEYEVTEPMGTWLADNWESAGPASFLTELEARGAAFYSQ